MFDKITFLETAPYIAYQLVLNIIHPACKRILVLNIMIVRGHETVALVHIHENMTCLIR